MKFLIAISFAILALTSAQEQKRNDKRGLLGLGYGINDYEGVLGHGIAVAEPISVPYAAGIAPHGGFGGYEAGLGQGVGAFGGGYGGYGVASPVVKTVAAPLYTKSYAAPIVTGPIYGKGYAAAPVGYAAGPVGYAAGPVGYAAGPVGYAAGPVGYAAAPVVSAPFYGGKGYAGQIVATPVAQPVPVAYGVPLGYGGYGGYSGNAGLGGGSYGKY